MKLVLACSKNWYFKNPKSLKYRELDIEIITTKDQLNIEFLNKINPRYIFFPHWNWKVSSAILNKYECIAFHTAPLPYGRGGSPIQNLISRGFNESPLCALRMTNEIDAGPIYIKKTISLEGNLNQIFYRIASATEDMILDICKNKIVPKEQEGESFSFKRLTKKDNELNLELSCEKIYDKIRMLDGADYPNAYISLGNYEIEFSKANFKNNQLKASVKFVKKID